MYQVNYSKKREKGKHLSFQERCNIEFMLKENKSLKEIAIKIGCSIKTISREKKRGMVYGLLNSDLSTRNEYCADKSQDIYDKNKKKKGTGKKLDRMPKLKEFIINKIKVDKYSPKAVEFEIKKDIRKFEGTICYKTIYNCIYNGIIEEISYQDLPYKRKKHKKYSPKKKNIRKKGAKSIEERSEVINNRREKGHWEMDTVVGKRAGRGTCLLVLTERVSRFEIIEKIERKNTKSVIKALNKLEKKCKKAFQEKFKTITTDNGGEFMDWQGIESSILEKIKRTEIYYAHSYCSYERGSNENNNKLIRRHFPKGTDFEKISKDKIKEVEKWINNYPRAIFGGKSAKEMYLMK